MSISYGSQKKKPGLTYTGPSISNNGNTVLYGNNIPSSGGQVSIGGGIGPIYGVAPAEPHIPYKADTTPVNVKSEANYGNASSFVNSLIPGSSSSTYYGNNTNQNATPYNTAQKPDDSPFITVNKEIVAPNKVLPDDAPTGMSPINTENADNSTPVGNGTSGITASGSAQAAIDNTNKEREENLGAVNNATQGAVVPLTYKEFLESEKNKAIQAAEVERQRAVIDANVAYEQNKAAYGANAEALRRQGMIGSGYSDYIDSQAYATSRGEVQQADVLAAQAKEKANTTYAENMLKLQEKEELAAKEEQEKTEAEAAEKQKNYLALLEAAGSGTYTIDQLKEFAKEFDLSIEQTAQLVETVNNYTEKSTTSAQNKAYQDLLASENLSMFAINAAVSSNSITAEMGQQLIEHIQNNNYLAFSYEISSGDIDQDAVRIALEAGELTQEQVDRLKEEYMAVINKIDTSTYFKNKTQDVAKVELETIEMDPWIPDDVKDKFNREYNNIFNPSANADDSNNQSSSISGTSYKSGENGYVNIYDSNYSSSHFGEYWDTGKAGTKQEKYVAKIVEDARKGKIPVGYAIFANYGATGETMCAFEYLGNGVFIKSKLHVSEFVNDGKLYIPEGYTRKSGEIKEK